MDNHEDYLDALTAYSRNPTQEIPPILEQYLNGVAKNGETLFQWPLLKPLIVGKMEKVISELRQGLTSENIPPRPNVENVRFDVMHERIMDALHKFTGAPFTIQRLCELLIDPKRHYKRSDKFMRGLEKNVLVVSTVDPFGRKVVSESGSKHLVNGMDTNGSPFFPRDSNISSNLPPVPGWVTSPVSSAAQRQDSPSVDSSDQRPTQQQASQDSTLTANGVPSGLVNSVYGDQGEQPLAVHAEEVVEETVVTMDTHEVGSVATGGGEALAEEEDEEEEIGADDTNASSSSSSSSSSEELSTSDTSDSSGSKATLGSVVSSSSETPSRPWASIASEGENRRDSVGEPDPSAVAESSSSPEKVSKDSPSESPSTGGADSPVSLDTPTAISSRTSSSDESPAQSDADESSTNTETQQSGAMDSSFGFEPDTSASRAVTANASTADDVAQKSEDSDPNSMNTSEVETENSASNEESIPTSTATSTTPNSTGTHLHPHASSSEHIRTYAEVVSTSSTDTFTRNFMPLDAVEECDSVAGLERLVDSVEPSPSLNLAVTSSVSSLPVQSLPTASQSLHKSDSHSVTPTSDSPIEEPQAKRCRLSEEASSPTLSSTTQSSTVSSSPADIKTTAESDIPADTTSDSNTTHSEHPSSNDSVETESPLDSAEAVPCTPEEAEQAPSAVELGGGDGVAQEQESAVTSPPSQLSSSSDSQGFDVCGDALRKTSIEEKQTSEEPAVGEVTPSEAMAEGQELVTESDGGPEPMDQE